MAKIFKKGESRTIILEEIDTPKMKIRRIGTYIIFVLAMAGLFMVFWLLFVEPESDIFFNLLIICAFILILVLFPFLTIADLVPNIPLIVYEDGIAMPLTWFGKYVLDKQGVIPYSDIRGAKFTKFMIFGRPAGVITIETIFDRVYSTGYRKDFKVLEDAAEILFKKLGNRYIEAME